MRVRVFTKVKSTPVIDYSVILQKPAFAIKVLQILQRNSSAFHLKIAVLKFSKEFAYLGSKGISSQMIRPRYLTELEPFQTVFIFGI